MKQDLFPPESSESLLWGEAFNRGERGGGGGGQKKNLTLDLQVLPGH